VTPAASRPGTYAAAAIAAAILLFPHGGNFAVLAYVLAPLAGVWIEIKARNQRLAYAQGASLGFRGSFYGMVAAFAIAQLAARIFDEQLWRFDNWYRLLPLLASKGLDTDTPRAWYLFMAQVTIGAVFAGMFAAPGGLLGVKLFARRHDVA